MGAKGKKLLIIVCNVIIYGKKQGEVEIALILCFNTRYLPSRFELLWTREQALRRKGFASRSFKLTHLKYPENPVPAFLLFMKLTTHRIWLRRVQEMYCRKDEDEF